MTIREVINSRVRLVMGLIYAGGGLFVTALVVPQALGRPPLFALAVPGFAVAFLTIFGVQLLGIRCPHCRGRLTSLALQRGELRIDPRVRYCPYCGVGLDEEVNNPLHQSC